MNLDLLTLNKTILDRFNIDIEKTDENIMTIKGLLEDPDLFGADIRAELERYTLINRKAEKERYIAKTGLYISEYIRLLKEQITPLTKDHITSRKSIILSETLDIIKELVFRKGWTDIRLLIDSMGSSITNQISSAMSSNNTNTTSSPTENYCSTCGNYNQDKFEADDVTRKITCLECSCQISTIETGHTHQDYTRVNIIGKFVYNRVLHFQDCIKQFQGKQNCKIPDVVYDDLNRKFKSYRLLIDSDNFHARYSKITPQHILMFLRELKYVKHYENVNVIYYVLTNKRIADISHLENKLIEDFKQLVSLYDSLHSKDKPDELDRKNFMNVQYLLFQLLRRHGYKCKLEDFSILKTIDRKLFHDKICSNLFQKLGWNFTPTF